MGRGRAATALVTTVLLGMCSVATGGCREVRPEAGLPASAFQGPTPRLVSNDRGFWFVVTDPTVPMKSWAVLGEQEPELAYVVPVGSRTARLLPATPFAYPWLDAQRNSAVALRWLDAPAEKGPADRIGFFSGASGDEVVWNSSAPPDDTPVALVAAQPHLGDASISSWIRGVGVVHGAKGLGQLTLTDGAQGPFLVIPEPARPPRPFRVTTLGGVQVSAPGVEIVAADAPVPPGAPNRWSLRPLAARDGADVIVSPGEVEGTVAVTMAAPVVVNDLPLALSQDTFAVPAEGLVPALRGLEAMRDGRYLAAAWFLDRAKPVRGALPVAELVAAAGYVDWMRHVALTGVSGLDADVAYYLARGHLAAGGDVRARDFAQQSMGRFEYWGAPAGTLGVARAGVLLGRIAAREGAWDEAALLTLEAAERFSEAEDEMRAAEAELLAATYLLEAGNAPSAVKMALQARSRFYHGHSPYASGEAEVALADLYRLVGEAGEAAKMARFAVLRFKELGVPVTKNRATMAEARVQAVAARSDGVRELEAALQRATEFGDEPGIVDAAASLVVLDAATPEQSARYAAAILEYRNRVADRLTRERAAQALALLCGAGIWERLEQADVSAWTLQAGRAACNAVPNDLADDAMLAMLVDQGWAAIDAGNVEDAVELAARAVEGLDERVRLNTPKLAAEALFLDAVALRSAGNAEAGSRAEDAIALLAKSVDPTRLAATYRADAARFAARGEAWLAAELFDAAMAAAADQSQAELRRQIALHAVEALHNAGELDAAREAIRVAEPVVEGAGAKSAPGLARLWSYEADILERLGRDADAVLTAKKAADARAQLDGPTQLDLTLFSAGLALDRGDVEATSALLTEAQALEEGLASGLSIDPAVRLLGSRALILRAELALRRGDATAANDEFSRALATLAEAGEDATPEILRARIVALHGAGKTAVSDAELADSIAALEKLRGRAQSKARDLLPAATAALAELEILAGRPGRALQLVEQAAIDGVSAAPTASRATCLAARARALSGRDEGIEQLGRCASRAEGAIASDASLLSALLTPQTDPGSRRRALRQHAATYGPDLSPRERERAELASELATGTEKPDAARAKKLRARVKAAVAAADDRAIVRAVEALAEHLIAAGESDDAASVVDQNSSAFYRLGGDGPGILARLRTRALVASLQPILALNFAVRAISETPDLAAADEAQILFAAAENAVLLGMWQHARSLLQDAHARATSAGHRRLSAHIQAFARRFELPLTD